MSFDTRVARRVTETWRFALAQKPGGRRRANVKINVFEQFELRSRSSVEASLLAKQERSIRRADRRAARLAAKNAPAVVSLTQDALTGTSFIVPAVRTTLTARLKPVRGYLTMLVFSVVAISVVYFGSKVKAVQNVFKKLKEKLMWSSILRSASAAVAVT